MKTIKEQLEQEGFDFTPEYDGKWHKIKHPIRGRYISSKFEHGHVVTVLSWDNDYKKVFKDFEKPFDESLFKEQIDLSNKQRLEINKAAAQAAKEIWDKAVPANPEINPYLLRKKLTEGFGARMDELGARLLVPVYDSEGFLWGVQRISPSDDDSEIKKRFIKGQRKEYCFHEITAKNKLDKVLCITEGFATAASINELTGLKTFVAFDSGNLCKVAKILRKTHTNWTIVIAGDNDSHGVGQRGAQKAAKESGGYVFLPPETDKDWNDLYTSNKAEVMELWKKFYRKLPKVRDDFALLELDEIMTMEMPEYDWVVKDLLLRGGTSSLNGLPKSGKSTITRKLALSVARGEPFFGRTSAQGRVLYIAVEEKLAQVKEHFKQLGATNEPITVHCSYVPSHLSDKLRELLTIRKYDLIICDTLAKTTDIEDLNDQLAVNKGLSPFHAIAKEFDTHIMFVAHLKKTGEGALAMAGSVALRGAFDSNMILHRPLENPQRRIFSSEQRYGVDFEAHIIDFDPVTREPKLGLNAAQVMNDEAVQSVIRAIKVLGENATPTELIGVANVGSNREFYRAIESGLEKGLIKRVKKGRSTQYLATDLAEIVSGESF